MILFKITRLFAAVVLVVEVKFVLGIPTPIQFYIPQPAPIYSPALAQSFPILPQVQGYPNLAPAHPVVIPSPAHQTAYYAQNPYSPDHKIANDHNQLPPYPGQQPAIAHDHKSVEQPPPYFAHPPPPPYPGQQPPHPTQQPAVAHDNQAHHQEVARLVKATNLLTDRVNNMIDAVQSNRAHFIKGPKKNLFSARGLVEAFAGIAANIKSIAGAASALASNDVPGHLNSIIAPHAGKGEIDATSVFRIFKSFFCPQY